MDFSKVYKRDYRPYLIAVAICFALLCYLAFISPGIKLGMDFTGGTLIRIDTDKSIDPKEIESKLASNFPLSNLSVISVQNPTGYGIDIQYSENTVIASAQKEVDAAESLIKTDPAAASIRAKNAIDLVKQYAVPENLPSEPEALLATAKTTLVDAKTNFENQLQSFLVQEFELPKDFAFQKKEIGAALGSAFWEAGILVVLTSFIFIVIVVFAFFREIIPSFAIIAAGIFDIMGGIGIMALLGIPVSLVSIPTLLMLIGYSIDTDILLTTRMLKRKEGTPEERAGESMKTGLTMTGTTLAALAAMIVIAYFNQISVIFEITSILIFGLLADIVATWFMNAPVLLWYVKRKEHKGR